jgi:hypothetical protein
MRRTTITIVSVDHGGSGSTSFDTVLYPETSVCEGYPLKAYEEILGFCDRMPPYHPRKTYGHKKYKATQTDRAAGRIRSKLLQFEALLGARSGGQGTKRR